MDSFASGSPRSLRVKLLSFLALLLGTTFALSYYFASEALETSFRRFEAEQLEQDVARVDAVIATELAALSRHTKDYGWWDTTYAYMASGGSAFLSDNFAPESMAEAEFDYALLLGTRGEVKAALQLGADNRSLELVPHDLNEYLIALTRTYLTDNPKAQHSGLIWNQDAAIMLAMTTVTDSKHSRPSRGYLVLGRRLTPPRLKAMARLAGVAFSLSARRSPRHPGPGHALATPEGLEAWRSTAALAGMEPAILHLNRAPSSRRPEQTSRQFLWAHAALLFGLTLLGTLFSLDRLVLRRLEEFARLARAYRHGRYENLHWPVRGRDELDHLADSLNGLMGEVQTAEQRLAEAALRDPLTGLGNRAQLLDRLALALALQARNPNLHAALLLVDLDNFRLVNESLGHAAGDALLQAQAQRLAGAVRQSDLAVRLEGDVFAIAYLSTEPPPDWQHAAERLLELVARPAEFRGLELATTASVGIAPLAELLTPETWLKHADIALFSAKRAGKHRAVLYDARLGDIVGERQALEQDLKHALANRALELWYQPIVDARTGQPVALEALIRWLRPEGYCPPDRFIPVAEDSDLIVALGRYTLEAGCRALVRFRAYHPRLELNINISARQLFERSLVTDVQNQLRARQLPTDALHLELTETLVAQNESALIPPMQTLVDAGISLHLDDFGTGYSSLGRLETLPISTLKLDRSFVRTMAEGKDAIARIVLLMARELGLAAIAEGVETAQDRDRLLALGCTRMQGYYFAKPMPEEAMLHWLAQQAERPAAGAA